ncbi:MAG: protein translocase subunit SecD, partial [Chloroflexi bacterium]|nr:protein translocase subunit SecD [Chloroflexota bacterium]
MSRNYWTALAIIVLSVFSLWVVWPQQPASYLPSIIPLPERGWIDLRIGDVVFVRKGMTLGLDLQGGTDIVLEADLSKVAVGEEARALEGVRQIIERRINAFGVTEPLIQLQGNNRVSIQLPGVKDVQEAKALIGKTAQLDFREQAVDASGQATWKKSTAPNKEGVEKELTGAYFQPNASVIFAPSTNRPEVAFSLTDEGAELFEKITTRILQKPLGIFLDDQLISAPTVQAVLRNNGVITGLELREAQTLAIQLNAGALPVPVKIIKEQDVDATLGADSVRKSIVAGEIGLAVVFLFMLLHYRLPGLLAGVALLNYAMYVLAIFKLIPVTLTLAGIAAFILSVGMAVDANILIFERMKEEVRTGRTVASAIEAGFDRAWPSIRDSNVSTFISCAILFWFGNSFGASLVMGFA